MLCINYNKKNILLKRLRINYKNIFIISLIIYTSLLCNCATQKCYFIDRKRDAADIFNASIGGGIGGRIRISLFHVGFLLLNNDFIGFKNAYYFHDNYAKTIDLGDVDTFILPAGTEGILNWPMWFGGEFFKSESKESTLIIKRNKEYGACSIIPFISTSDGAKKLITTFTPYYYTQIEAIIGFVPSLRLGFNPGELIDFILGWTTIDIFNDDVGIVNIHKKTKEERIQERIKFYEDKKKIEELKKTKK